MSDQKLEIIDNELTRGSTEYITNDLFNRLKMYENTAHKHKKHEKYYNNIFRALGFPQVIFGLIVSILFGSSGFVRPYNTLSIVGFVFGLSQTVLSATLIFFNIQEKSSKYHNTSGQLSDVAKDLRVFLLYDHNFDELEEMENLLLEKEKFIDSYAPNLSGIISK